jgi:hypothetical protein
VLRKEFQDFRKTAQLYTAGLNFFLERRHDQAMNAFKLALVADNQVEHMEVKRATQIMCSIKFCLHVHSLRPRPFTRLATLTFTHSFFFVFFYIAENGGGGQAEARDG